MRPSQARGLPQARRLPQAMGFRSGGVHQSRTMMLSELTLLFDGTPAEATTGRYREAIVEENLLGKATRSARLDTARYLSSLYALDPTIAAFRLLRRFWGAEQEGKPMLACLAATARDALLRDCADTILGVPHGQAFGATAIAEALATRYPARYRPTTLRSTAQNLASTWTQAGFLAGKVAKRRSRPIVTTRGVAYALALGHLAGSRGKFLLDSPWARLLDRTPSEVMDLAVEASKEGWLRLKTAGTVVEVSFPGLLTPAEERSP